MRNLDEIFVDLLEDQNLDVNEISADELRTLCAEVCGDASLFDEVADGIEEYLAAHAEAGVHNGDSDLPAGFDLTVGNWAIDLNRAGIRTAIMSTLVAGALANQGMVQMSIGIVTAVLPSVVDIERVKLSAGDRRMVLDLRLKRKVRDGALSEDELYDQLPRNVRKSVNRYDFATVVERLREAGLIIASEEDSLIVRDPDERRPWIRWK